METAFTGNWIASDKSETYPDYRGQGIESFNNLVKGTSMKSVMNASKIILAASLLSVMVAGCGKSGDQAGGGASGGSSSPSAAGSSAPSGSSSSSAGGASSS